MGSNPVRMAVLAMGLLTLTLLPVIQACETTSHIPPSPPTAAVASALTSEEMDGPGHNGLSARSLLYNAITENPNALRLLLKNPLNDALFDANKHEYMSRQLVDSAAQDVMGYIVSCALDRSERVAYVDPASHARHVWTGAMGLCPGWSKAPPSEKCVRLVSSCLFARTNRLHSWVPALFTGPDLPAPRDRVAIATRYAKGDVHAGVSEGEAIPAFSRGWQPGYVGRCVPGKPIALAVPAASRCARTALRVCKGIRGCQPDSARFVGEAHGACDAAPMRFTCPAEGFYGVMTRPNAVEVAQRSGEGNYPAAEKDVFPFMEGAFFGNLFDPDGLTRLREVELDHGSPKVTDRRLSAAVDADDADDDDAVPHRHIYGCYSLANDQDGVAYLDARICAKPGGKRCFPNPPRRCHFKDPELQKEKGYHCKWKSSDGLYRDCKGVDDVSYPTITVYLNEPCDLQEPGCAVSLTTAPPD
jgi:hypothetical protein